MNEIKTAEHRSKRSCQASFPGSLLVRIAVGNIFILGAFVSGLAVAQDGPNAFFAAKVQPIFEKHCVQCHGESEPEAGLRLISRKHILGEADSGIVPVHPGSPDKSELFRRLVSDDETERMPPDGDPLKASEIEAIKKWIRTGAAWPETKQGQTHWGYQPIGKIVLPHDSNDKWSRNEIDRLIWKQLIAKGLKPSPQQDPERLLRRVYFALTGLPPTKEQVQAFIEDPSDSNYESIVDKLLTSPRYGERWAQPWLDLARYADSNGFQADQLRDSWAYRDWVIRAINEDKPFDQFTIEQLAGDLLPNATAEQKIATGFHRAATCNVEAGVHPEQNRINQVFDRVNTTGTVFFGSTFECAQCHNHKYDPMSQDEYYRLFAFFNNTPIEVKLQSGVQYNFYGPQMDLPLPVAKAAARKKLLDRKAGLEKEILQVKVANADSRKVWESEIRNRLKNPTTWQQLTPSGFESTGGETHQMKKDGSVLIGGSLPGTSIYTVTFPVEAEAVSGFRLDVLTDPSLPGKGPGRGDADRTNFILSEFTAEVFDGKNWQSIKFKNAFASFSQAKWNVATAIDGDRKTGWAIAPQFKKPHWAVFELQNAWPKQVRQVRFKLDQNYGRGRTIGRFKISFTRGDLSSQALPKPIRNILSADKPPTERQQAQLEKYYETNQPELVAIRNQIEKIQKQLDQLKPKTTLVMVEMNKPRESRKLIRGDYLNPGKKVEPGVPAMLHPFDSNLPNNRLGLAKWIVDSKNPLTARVVVNRWWAQFFGRGIVSTQEDFGIQAEPPTHPLLLDWLANELKTNGWSRKKIHRQIVLSSTFRQSATMTKQLRQIDPQNKWYARGPRMRMSAEMIRDNGLAVSGLLSTKNGGAPIMPYQPNGIWRAVGRNAPTWVETKGADRFSRGIYVVWRRAAPYPSFVNFDAPDRAACVVDRSRTNTPLQALTLLNDQAFLEMALAAADQVDLHRGDEHAIGKLWKQCLGRNATEAEIQILNRLLGQQRDWFNEEPNRASQLLKSLSNVKTVSKMRPVELAAWTLVANTILNLDETIHY